MNNPAALVDSTNEPTFAIDLRGKVLAWNRAAEHCFGHRSSEVVGRFCWEVLAGRDPFGNRYCGPGCPIIGMAKRHEAIHRAELDIQTAAGWWSRFRVGTLLVPGDRPSDSALLHHVSRVKSPGDSRLARRRKRREDDRRRARLTPRERELLGHLAEGKGTEELAELLCVSKTTVRNHVRHILRKLRVHSRLEAVACGRRLDLI